MSRDKDSLGDRMKRYEAASKLRLPPRLPLIIRADGKAFHTLTRDLEKPFDKEFAKKMLAVAVALCQEISGAMVAYVQSDEISILVRDDRTHDSQAWFDKELDKTVSVAAGIASAEMSLALGRRAVFDARAFVLPPSDVVNYFIWRQQDATRNSVSMAAHGELSKTLGAKEAQALLHGKTWGEQQEILFGRCGINWSRDYPTFLKRGAAVRTVSVEKSGFSGLVTRREWGIDYEIPVFGQERDYIEKFLRSEELPNNSGTLAEGRTKDNGNV